MPAPRPPPHSRSGCRSPPPSPLLPFPVVSTDTFTTQKELERLEELIDHLDVTGPGVARRDGLLKLASWMASDASAASFANSRGAQGMLLRGLEGAVKRGDEDLVDAISTAVAQQSRCEHGEDAVELMAVGGSQARRVSTYSFAYRVAYILCYPQSRVSRQHHHPSSKARQLTTAALCVLSS